MNENEVTIENFAALVGEVDTLRTNTETLRTETDALINNFNNLFIFKTGQTSSFSLAPQTYVEKSIQIDIPDGYKSIGILSWSTATGSCSPTRLSLNSIGTLNTIIRNNSSQTEASVVFSATILCALARLE